METKTELQLIVIEEAEYWRSAPPVTGPNSKHPKEFVMIHVFVNPETKELIERQYQNGTKCNIAVQGKNGGAWQFPGRVVEFEQKATRKPDEYPLVMFTVEFLDAVGPAFFL